MVAWTELTILVHNSGTNRAYVQKKIENNVIYKLVFSKVTADWLLNASKKQKQNSI